MKRREYVKALSLLKSIEGTTPENGYDYNIDLMLKCVLALCMNKKSIAVGYIKETTKKQKAEIRALLPAWFEVRKAIKKAEDGADCESIGREVLMKIFF